MPEIYEEILSLVFFIVQKGAALSRCDLWSVSHEHPSGRPIVNAELNLYENAEQILYICGDK
jgi:hypothetical protein